MIPKFRDSPRNTSPDQTHAPMVFSLVPQQVILGKLWEAENNI